MNRIKETHQPEDTILLIGHGGTFKAILPFLDETVSRKSLRDTWLKHTDIVKIEMSKIIRSVIIYHTENMKVSDVFDTQ